MRFFTGFIGGAVCSIVACVLLGATGSGGAADQITLLAGILIGFTIGFPAGFLLGSAFQSAVLSNEPPRRSVEEFAPQIVGRRCAVCETGILLITDGARCERCDSVYHTACAAACPKCTAPTA